jgi:hypothetical protein
MTSRSRILREIPDDISCLGKALEDPKAYWEKHGVSYNGFSDMDPVVVFQGIKATLLVPHECDCLYCHRDFDQQTLFFINDDEYTKFINNADYVDEDEIDKDCVWLIGKFKQDTDYELGDMAW